MIKTAQQLMWYYSGGSAAGHGSGSGIRIFREDGVEIPLHEWEAAVHPGMVVVVIGAEALHVLGHPEVGRMTVEPGMDMAMGMWGVTDTLGKEGGCLGMSQFLPICWASIYSKGGRRVCGLPG